MSIIYFVSKVIGLAACIYALIVYPTMPKVYDVTVSFLLGVIATNLGGSITDAWGFIRLAPVLVWLVFTGRPLRISFAALIRIQVDDDFFLVRSKRFAHFQPVGGVYKFFDQALKAKFGLESDELKSPSVDELRLRFKPGQVRHAFKFLRWYNTRCERESTPNREFKEELINTGILFAAEFEDIAFKYVRTETPLISYSKQLRVHELRSFEIFEAILTEPQKSAIRGLRAQSSDQYCFLTAEEIDRDGFRQSTHVKLGTQTKYILD